MLSTRGRAVSATSISTAAANKQEHWAASAGCVGWVRIPAGPSSRRAVRQLPCQLHRAVPRLHVDDVPPGDQVFGLDETARRSPVSGPSPPYRTNSPVSSSRAAKSHMNCTCAPTSSGVHWSIGAQSTAGPATPVVLEQQVLGHHVSLRVRHIVAVFTPGTEPRAGSRHPTGHFLGLTGSAAGG